MPNRAIKESICYSDEIDKLSPEAEVLFYRLMVNCDDFGRLDARPQIIRARCFPLRIDHTTTKNVEDWLRELIEAGLLYVYQVEDKQYVQMTKWEKHQQKRAKHSKFPSPDNGEVVMISSDINCNQLQEYVPENRESRIETRESRRGEKTPSKVKDEKEKYHDFVKLSPDEYTKLCNRYGEQITRRFIDKVGNWKGAKGKKYKSDYRGILNWIARDEEEKGVDYEKEWEKAKARRERERKDGGFIDQFMDRMEGG